MIAASCFSGIGGAELALPEAEWLWCAEIEDFPSAVLAKRFGHPNLGDITAPDFIERARALGPLDLLCGGPPCQAFSVAGLRKGMADPRGQLSLRFIEIAHELASANGLRNLLVENVPGWLSHEDNAFGCFLGELVGADDALPNPIGGSWPRAGMVAGPRARAAWRVLDAQYAGLAQRRKRVFLVADFGNGADPVSVLFERKSLSGHHPPRRETGQDVAGTLSARTESGGGLGTDFDIAGGLQPVAAEIAPTLNAAFDLRGREGGAQFEGPHDTANIRAASGGSSRSYVAESWAVRRLSVTECERLQGYPDGHTLIEVNKRRTVVEDEARYLLAKGAHVALDNQGRWRTNAAADGPRYKALGNAWAVACVRPIALGIMRGLAA